MKPSNIKIDIEIEPVVKLSCMDNNCRFKIFGSFSCNFKHVRIGKNGECLNKEPKREDK